MLIYAYLQKKVFQCCNSENSEAGFWQVEDVDVKKITGMLVKLLHLQRHSEDHLQTRGCDTLGRHTNNFLKLLWNSTYSGYSFLTLHLQNKL